MEITPIVTPALYMSMLALFVATVGFRMALHSLIRARRARVTLRRVPSREFGQRQLPAEEGKSDRRTTI